MANEEHSRTETAPDEIDWTLVDELLAMPPLERLEAIVESSKNYAKLLDLARERTE